MKFETAMGGLPKEKAGKTRRGTDNNSKIQRVYRVIVIKQSLLVKKRTENEEINDIQCLTDQRESEGEQNS